MPLPDDLAPDELLERIWERDPTVWTGRDEAQWLGWLDEPLRMRERLPELQSLRDAYEYERVVVVGMGGSSLAPLVYGQALGAPIEVLDTTHPGLIRRLELEGALFVVASKSGTTLETRCHFDFLWERTRRRKERFLVITDPGSPLEELASARGIATVAGEPSIGGRYSALSPFGLVPALLGGIEVDRVLERAERMREACREAAANPGLETGLALGFGWRQGRDKVVSANPFGFGFWLEQLIAESTGKDGKGLVPAPGERPQGADRQWVEVRLDDPWDLGGEFFRFELAVAVAGSILGVNPFDQPDVQETKERTEALLFGRVRGTDPGTGLEGMGAVETLLEQARLGDYIAVLAFIDPAREQELEPLVRLARGTGCVVTVGLGPRYLHSTGQLHKGGPATGIFVQVVDDPGQELSIPGRPFGFKRLIQAQAEGDYAALRQRGRRVARVRLEEL